MERRPRFGKIGLIMLILVLAILVGADTIYYRERLYPGVALGELTLGGLPLTDAQALLEEHVFSTGELTLLLNRDEHYVFSLSELGLAWDRAETIRLLRAAGRSWSGMAARFSYWRHGTLLVVPAGFCIDETRLDQALDVLAAAINRPAKPASFQINGEEVTIDPGEAGCFLDTELLRERVLAALKYGCPHLPVKIPVNMQPARPGAVELAGCGVQGLMAFFATDVSGTMANRVHNIGLGAASIHGCLLAPGEEFSFNQAIGPSTREKGYREAPVIDGNRLVPGLGGGLCQVSSTLYNAALLANLAITARCNHTLTVSYLPPGRDATVAYGLVDLKFVNNHSHHILIGAELEENQLVCRIFGLPLEGRVQIETSGLCRIEAPVQERKTDELPEGTRELVQRGKPGFCVTIWRVFYRGGKEVCREMLSDDYYEPVPYIYRVGTGPKNRQSEANSPEV